MDPNDNLPDFEIIWTASEIAREINRTPRQTVHLLETGKLPAKKVGGRWCAIRHVLRQSFFAEVVSGDGADQ